MGFSKIEGRRALGAIVVAAGLVVPGTVFAQDAEADKATVFVPEDAIVEDNIEDREGVDGLFTINGNINLVQNDSVVGQVDGFSLLFGLGVKAGLDWISGRHEIRNTLTIDESWARTPVLDEFVKNNDEIAFNSIYNYFFLDWAGAFARLEFQSALLKTEDVRADPVTYNVTRLDGSVDTIADVNRLELAGSFEPFSMYQSGGLFAEPFQSDPVSVSIRLGLGARETFANGVLILDDDDATAEIEATELDNVFQGGAEGFLGASGRAYEGRFTYDLGASVLVPFLNNDPEERAATDLIRYGITGALNFSVFTWMGLSYKLKVISDPQLLDDIQIQNNLLLSFAYSFVERGDVGPPKPTIEEVQEKAAAAEKRAEEAEARAAEAEARAAEAEKAAEEAADEAEEVEEVDPPADDTTDGDTTGDTTGGDATGEDAAGDDAAPTGDDAP